MQTRSSSKSQPISKAYSDNADEKTELTATKGLKGKQRVDETREEFISRKFKDLLAKGYEPLEWESDPIKRQLMSGSWALSAIEGINTAVRKLLAFGEENKIKKSALIPLSNRLLHEFIVWAGRSLESPLVNNQKHKIKAATIDSYITGIKSWHLFHDEFFPDTQSHKTRLLLKAAEAGDAELGLLRQRDKPPVLLKHLGQLLQSLTKGGGREQAALMIALMAFWGMARLGELVGGGKRKRREVLMRDVVWAKD